MNSSSNKTILFFKFVLIPAIFIKLLYSICLFFLDKSLENKAITKNIPVLISKRINLGYKILTIKRKKEEPIKVEKKITDFKLKGTYVNGEDSFIIIEDGKNTEFIYLNETYQGYKLIKVYENKAIFEKNSQQYELSMDTNSLLNKININTSRDIDADVLVPIDIPKSEVNYYVNNPDKIWNNIRINDYKVDDGYEFKISYIKKGSIFDKIGLKPGDTIIAINGQKPQSIADVMQYYINIDTLDSLILTIQRNNQEMDIEFRVKE